MGEVPGSCQEEHRACRHPQDGRFLLARQRTKYWCSCPKGTSNPARLSRPPWFASRPKRGTPATVTGFVGVVEQGYVGDGATHHEINLVFHAGPVSLEDRLEFHWLAHRHPRHSRRPARGVQGRIGLGTHRPILAPLGGLTVRVRPAEVVRAAGPRPKPVYVQ